MPKWDLEYAFFLLMLFKCPSSSQFILTFSFLIILVLCKLIFIVGVILQIYIDIKFMHFFAHKISDDKYFEATNNNDNKHGKFKVRLIKYAFVYIHLWENKKRPIMIGPVQNGRERGSVEGGGGVGDCSIYFWPFLSRISEAAAITALLWNSRNLKAWRKRSLNNSSNLLLTVFHRPKAG